MATLSGWTVSVFRFSSKGKNMDKLMFVQDPEINAERRYGSWNTPIDSPAHVADR